ncbi:MAG TPA: IS1634 family transposase [Thermoanaerobaculia bacterium]|nr:IS1634 family transposase [Thermoanaerobaculia bacterium]
MHIETVPNRGSKPCILLRESYRQDGKVCKRTLANLSHLPPAVIDGLRVLLRGGTPVDNLAESFDVRLSQPYGHLAAVLGTLRQLGLERDLDPQHSRQRDLVVAMIVARIVEPASKLATARGLGEEAPLSALVEKLGLEAVDEAQLYAAMDWLFVRQSAIEQQLASRHLHDGSLVLYDVTSTYFEGRCCPLARLGHSRDGKKDKLQIVFGLLCNHEGCPVAVQVFEGNTGDPKTLGPQLDKLRKRFGLNRIVLVGDRGMLTSARLREDVHGVAGLDWISALRTTEIRKLFAQPGFQFSIFDQRDMVELRSPEDFPGERLIACLNPLLQAERARKREDLLQATEKDLDAIVEATKRPKRRLQGKVAIALRAGKVLNRFKVAKHFVLDITDTSFSYRRNQESIVKEAALDGIYVIRTSVPVAEFPAEDVVRSYKSLSTVERAFRSYKTVDLHVRPIFHTLPERVKAHVFLCMLAYYVEWHMRKKLAPMLFDDDDPEAARAQRSSIVAPAVPSPSAQSKAATLQTPDGLPVHSFQTLLQNLATIVKNRIQPKPESSSSFDMITRPTALQQKALSLLSVAL